MSEKRKILFLCYRVSQGFGVEAVIHEQAARLLGLGFEIHIACVELALEPNPQIVYHELLPGAGVLSAFLISLQPSLVVAHTQPWMSLLAEIPASNECGRWVWEHGDPTPELIPQEKESRQREKDLKREKVYPLVDRVFAISEFIRRDIGWPNADVVYNGCPTVEDLPRALKTPQSLLRVGVLMRMGVNEAKYKGADKLVELSRLVAQKRSEIKFAIMGRGRDVDADVYRKAGFEVYLNASDAQKFAYLRGLDVLVSPSQWEGFNLPLVEAQSLGTHAIAFDVAVHPEVCPFVFSSPDEMAGYLDWLAKRPGVVQQNASIGKCFVRRRFSYDSAVDTIVRSLAGLPPAKLSIRPSRRKLFLMGIQEGIGQRGLMGFSLWFAKKIARKLLKRA